MTDVAGFDLEPEEAEVAPQKPGVIDLVQQLQNFAEEGNVTEYFSDDEMATLGGKVVQEYRVDKESRSEWEATAERAMKMARQVKEGKSWPWPGASNVKYPMLTTAALQFAARAYPAIMGGPRIVKVKVAGKDEGGEKAARADRVSQHMSYQLTQELQEWEEDLDTLLHQIPVVGCAFRKVYHSELSDAGFCSDLVSAMDLVVNQKAKHLDTVPRITHVITLYPYEVEERRRSGRFRNVDIDFKTNDEGGEDEEAPQTFLEQHRFWDSDGDGLAEPWVITVHEGTETVVRMTPNFDPKKIKANDQEIVSIPRKNYFVKIPFIPDPDGGFYDIGFGKLLESTSDIVDTTINQMMDAGTLQNAGGGLIGGGLKMGKSKITRRPGEYQTVEAAGSDIKNAVYDFQHPGPSQVLFNLLGLMIEAGKDIAAIKDVLTGDNEKTMTATTTMALIEQGLKVFSAIFKRIYRSLTQEFKLIYACNRDYLSEEKYFAFLDEEGAVAPQDYADDLNVQPSADPNVITDMQKMVRAQFLLEQVKNGNPFIDGFEATKRALEAAAIERIDEVLKPPPEGPNPIEEAELERAAIENDKLAAEVKKTLAEAEAKTVGAAIEAMQPPELVDGQPQTAEEQPNMLPEPMMPQEMGPEGMPPEAMPGGQMPPEMMDPEMLAQMEAEQMAMQQGQPGPETMPMMPGEPQ